MIPLFGLSAAGGSILSLDDSTVVKDGAALDGSGGTVFSPYLVSAPIRHAVPHGWARFRQFSQRVEHDGTVTLTFSAFRDGGEQLPAIDRPLALGASGPVNIGLAATGSVFQIRILVSAFSGPVYLYDSQAVIVGHRATR